MTREGFAWECSCGILKYGEESPDECLKCGGLDSFIKMPAEIIEEREKDLVRENNDIILNKSTSNKISNKRKKK